LTLFPEFQIANKEKKKKERKDEYLHYSEGARAPILVFIRMPMRLKKEGSLAILRRRVGKK
jgi:hypothetical protein